MTQLGHILSIHLHLLDQSGVTGGLDPYSVHALFVNIVIVWKDLEITIVLLDYVTPAENFQIGDGKTRQT